MLRIFLVLLLVWPQPSSVGSPQPAQESFEMSGTVQGLGASSVGESLVGQAGDSGFGSSCTTTQSLFFANITHLSKKAMT